MACHQNPNNQLAAVSMQLTVNAILILFMQRFKVTMLALHYMTAANEVTFW